MTKPMKLAVIMLLASVMNDAHANPSPPAHQIAIPQATAQLMEDYIALAQKMSALLGNVHDAASADENAASLEELLPQLMATQREFEQQETPSLEVSQLLTDTYGMKLRRAWGDVYEHIFRLQRNQCFGSTSFAQQFHQLCMMINM